MTGVVSALRDGGVIVLPTDTVYGLACLPTIAGAVDAIFRLKGRRDDKPLPVLGDGVHALGSVAEFDDRARALAERFWPGPLTLVLPRAAGFDLNLGGDDLATVAVRVPENEKALGVLSESGPLAVTSANRSGEPPATGVAEAREIFGTEVAAYIDGGPCIGLPSTVVSLVGPVRVLRDGVLDAGEVLG